MLTPTQIKIIGEFNDDVSRMADEIESLRDELDTEIKNYEGRIEKLEQEISDHQC